MPETSDPTLADIRDLVLELGRKVDALGGSVADLDEKVGALAGTVEGLEAEFAPLARKYSGIVSAAAKLPGVGLGRRGKVNGTTIAVPAGHSLGARPGP